MSEPTPEDQTPHPDAPTDPDATNAPYNGPLPADAKEDVTTDEA